MRMKLKFLNHGIFLTSNCHGDLNSAREVGGRICSSGLGWWWMKSWLPRRIRANALLTDNMSEEVQEELICQLDTVYGDMQLPVSRLATAAEITWGDLMLLDGHVRMRVS
jgi:hypothetical protein